MTDDFLGGKFKFLLLVILLGSVDGIELGSNEGIGLGKSLVSLDEILLGKYDVIELGSS